MTHRSAPGYRSPMIQPVIVVHGGAGAIAADDHARACAAGCLAAARIGHAVLARGGSALEAVEAAVVALEDDPLFNAGTGSCLNAEGDIEMDAAVMDGRDLTCGAVAALKAFPNPVKIARLVRERTGHVLLAGEGAARFARAQGLVPCPPARLATPRALERWDREKEGMARKNGTVGAVALDAAGHVAAATSTGGTSGKLPGRVGDTPLVGCGTYADDRGGAASATGHGESIVRVVLAKFACDRMAAGLSARRAAEEAIRELERVRGEGGIILVDRQGGLGLAFNTARMSRAWIAGDGSEGSAFEP
jgi:beta-aspartyl-peptidase (threonine type)